MTSENWLRHGQLRPTQWPVKLLGREGGDRGILLWSERSEGDHSAPPALGFHDARIL